MTDSLQKKQQNKHPAEQLSPHANNTKSWRLWVTKPWFAPVFFLLISLLYYSPYLTFNTMIVGSDDGSRGWHVKGFNSYGSNSFFDKWSTSNGGSSVMERRFGRFLKPPYPLYHLMPMYAARTIEYVYCMFAAGICAFFFLGSLGISKRSRYIGALAYMLAPASLSYIIGGHFARMEVLAFLPGLMYFTQRMLHCFSPINFVGLPIMIALLTYSDHAQLAYFSYLGMCAYFAITMIYLFISKKVTIVNGLKRTGLFTVAGIVGLFLIGMNVFPARHNAETTSKRAGTAASYEFAASFSLHPEEIFNLVQPDFIGNAETYWGQNALKINSEYCGIIIILLAALLFVLKRHQYTAVILLCMLFIAMLFTLGPHTPVHRLFFEFVPGIKTLRGPSMMYIWFFLPFVALAALGLDALLTTDWKNNPQLAKRILIVTGVTTGLFGIYMLAAKPFMLFWYNSLFPAAARSESLMQALLHNAPKAQVGALIQFFLVAGFFSCIYLLVKEKITHTHFFTALLILISIDLLRVSIPYMLVPSRPKNIFIGQDQFEKSLVDYLHAQDKGLYRVHPMLNDEKMMINGLDMTYVFDDFTNKNYDDIVQILRSVSYAIVQPQYSNNPMAQSFFCNLLALLNAKYILTITNFDHIPQFKLIISQGTFRIYENTWVLPRFYCANGVIPSNDTKQDLLNRLESGTIPKDSVFVDTNISKTIQLTSAIDSSQQNSITLDSYEINKGYESLTVVSDRSQILVSLENFDPGWKVFVNGKQEPLIRVNHYAKGVVVKPGSNRVEFRYNSEYSQKWRKITTSTAIVFFVVSLVIIGMWARKKYGVRKT